MNHKLSVKVHSRLLNNLDFWMSLTKETCWWDVGESLSLTSKNWTNTELNRCGGGVSEENRNIARRRAWSDDDYRDVWRSVGRERGVDVLNSSLWEDEEGVNVHTRTTRAGWMISLAHPVTSPLQYWQTLLSVVQTLNSSSPPPRLYKLLVVSPPLSVSAVSLCFLIRSPPPILTLPQPFPF